MKKRVIILALCILLMSVSLAQALPQYIISGTGQIGTGGGGPFQVAGNGMNFQTFCIETREYLSADGKTPYYGSIDPLVYYSSGGSTFSALISGETAKLYNYFLDKQTTLTLLEKDLIQQAIWMYQDQPDWSDDPNNWWYANASTLIATNRTIMALNLWTTDIGVPGPEDYDYKKQSLLIATPEPGILMLLGLGLAGILGIKRKFKS